MHMKSSVEFYLEWLETITGAKGEFHLITEEGETPPLWVILYRDTPESGSLTAFTYGLSSVDHPDWKLGCPELVICVDSNDINWGLAVGLLAKKFRRISPFSYGTIHRFGEKISDESEMTAFLVFAPSIIDQENARVELPDRTINVVQMYPIYEQEIDMIKFAGISAFLDELHNPYDVRRKAFTGDRYSI